MAQYNRNWDDLGRNIQDIVDRAVNSHDYQKLNQAIRQVVDKAVDKGGEAVRRAMENSPRPVQKPQIVEAKKNLPALYGNPNGKTTAGILKIVGGSILSAVGILGLVAAGVVNCLAFQIGAAPFVLALGGTAAGAGLLTSGIRGIEWVSRFKKYRKALGEKTHIALKELARAVGKPEKFVRKEVRKMIDSGLFLEGHLDNEQTRLIVSDETYRLFEQSRLQLEQRQRLEEAMKAQKKNTSHSPQVQEVLDRGDAFIEEIRRCNDAIPGHEISAKIFRMETIVQKIFDRAEAHPEVVPDLKKLMDYYLPMTVKLLNAYADMDAQPIQGENIQASKREIEATLDTLNIAFEKLLDDLFADTAMDVSSDISVLHTLLAQEGLAEDDLSKMKKQQNL